MTKGPSLNADPSADFMDMISVKIAGLPHDVQSRLWQEWYVLKANGCEMFDMDFTDGELTIDVSHDFRQFLADFGISI